MKIMLVNPRGFCAGVTRAVQIVERALEVYKQNVFVRHDIVHNKTVVDNFKKRGVVFVEELCKVPNPSTSTIILSAHGSALSVMEEAKAKFLRVIDATCPLVVNVHKAAKEMEEDGCAIVLIGHQNHAEVIGTLGQLNKHAYVISSIDEIPLLPLERDAKVGYVTQTTLNYGETLKIIKALGNWFSWLIHPPKNNICYATQNRQEALTKAIEAVDMVIIIGSKHSSNTARLAEMATIAKNGCIMVDSAEELNIKDFKSCNSVAISAGASAPEELVQQVVAWLKKNFTCELEEAIGTRENFIFPLPKELR